MTSTPPMLLHSTYFNLGPNNTPDVRQAYMATALENLSTAKGLASFWIGERAKEMTRAVNDTGFDIAMHQLFKDKASFDIYNGSDPKHERFVQEVNKWAPATTRRVLDTYLSRLILGGNASAAQQAGADGNTPPGLFHNLYFDLVDKSPDNIKKFTDICVRFLSPHPGITQFATGGLTDIVRDVSVRNFDVCVSIIYESKQAHEEYSHSELHDAFFPATTGMIANTYVFDAYIKYESKVYTLPA